METLVRQIHFLLFVVQLICDGECRNFTESLKIIDVSPTGILPPLVNLLYYYFKIEGLIKYCYDGLLAVSYTHLYREERPGDNVSQKNSVSRSLMNSLVNELFVP